MLKQKQLNSGKRVNVYLGLSVVCVAFTILKLSTYKFSSSDESLVGKSGTFQQVEMNKTLPLGMVAGAHKFFYSKVTRTSIALQMHST